LDAIRPDGLDAWFTYFVRALLFSALYSVALSESLLALIWIGRNPARNTLKVMIGIGALGLVILLMGGISEQKKLLAPVFPATWTTRPFDIYTTVGMGMPSGHVELLLYIRWLFWKVVELVDPCDSYINACIDGVIVLILWSTLWWEFHYISQCFIGLVVAALLINLVRNVSARVSSYITPS
jgi:membrane-associated phospholipid phosphatase